MIFIKVDNIVDACVEFCILKKEFLNLTINMQLLYFITTVISQVHSSRHHQCAGYSAVQDTVLYRASSLAIDFDFDWTDYSQMCTRYCTYIAKYLPENHHRGGHRSSQ